MHRFIFFLTVVALAVPSICIAEDSSPGLAATTKLPAALVALEPDSAEILSHDEADKIRGQWILNLNLPLFTTVIHGHSNKFELNLLTLSGGANAGTPMVIQIQVGR